MKKSVKFALVICLVVLALVIALSLAYPSVQETMSGKYETFGEFLGGLWEKIVAWFQHRFIKGY